MAAGDAFDAALELLNACQAALATTPGGAIDRAYVSPGLPAFDCCPQITVHAGGTGEGDTAPLAPPLSPGHRANVQGTVPMLQLTVTVIRCSPVWEENAKQPPSPAALQAAAEVTYNDVWAIWSLLRDAKRAETLFAPASREFFFDPAFPVLTSGGCAGWQLPFRVALGGY